METMEQRRKRPRRSFSDEYKAEVVELCRTSGRSISEVSHDLGLTVDRGAPVGRSGRRRRSPAARDDLRRREELVQLRKENRVLREDATS